MPWKPSDAKEHTKKANTPEKQKQWAATANAAREQCIKDGGESDECDGRAIRIANAAVGKKGREVMGKLTDLVGQIAQVFGYEIEDDVERKWDGAASNYDSTKAYCSACLIDVNAAAGRDEKTQSHCMLPVKQPGSGDYDWEGIKAAAGGHGVGRVKRPDDVPEADWTAAVKKAANILITQYGKNDAAPSDTVYELAGKEPPEERAIGTGRMMQQFYNLLRTSAATDDEYPSVVDIYFDDGDLYGLVVAGGKLYQYQLAIAGDDLQIMGERVQVGETHQPIAGERSTTIYRQADGKVRWITLAATAVLNRVSEIDSTTLFDNMIKRAQGEAGYPYLTLWHCGETFSMGRADFLARDGYVYIASGLLDAGNELAEAVARDVEAAPDFWGTSIKYRPAGEPEMVEIAEDVRIPVYRDGTNVEISLLPEKYAASWFTASGTIEEVQRMRAEVEDLLKKLLGDKAEAWIGKIDGVNRQIEDEGMIARSEGSSDGTPPCEAKPIPPATDAEVATPQPVVELDEDAAGALARAIAGSQEFTDLFKPVEKLRADLDALFAKVDEMGALATRRLDALERTDEEKQREWLADLPPHSALRVTYRPRQAAAALPVNIGLNGPEDPAAIALEKIRAAKANIR